MFLNYLKLRTLNWNKGKIYMIFSAGETEFFIFFGFRRLTTPTKRTKKKNLSLKFFHPPINIVAKIVSKSFKISCIQIFQNLVVKLCFVGIHEHWFLIDGVLRMHCMILYKLIQSGISSNWRNFIKPMSYVTIWWVHVYR